MNNNLSESKSQLKVSLIAIESNTEHYGTDYEFTQTYGYRVYDNHPLAEVREVEAPSDKRLYLGSYEVNDYRDSWNEFQGKIPVWYCVRTLINTIMANQPTSFWEFVCGMDLMSDGRVWVGIEDKKFDTIEEAMNFVQKHTGKECSIFTEDKMLL